MEFEPDKIEKIVYNLLSNAFKYTLEMGLVTLTIKCIDENIKKLQIIVKDSGIGISEENQQNIFSLYYQADNAQIKGINGTGVGLYLVKTYTELHEGNVTFTSKLDSGSTFMVEIPVKEKSTHLKIGDAEILNTDKLNQFRFTTESNKVKILIVEDNVDIMFFLKNELEDFFTIYSAKNGVEAIKILNSVKPDLILSDVMMPQMDGYELCKKIKNNISTCHIPIIMLTAKISHESQLEGYAAGANDYLTKPFNSEILIAKIQRILELRKQIQLKILNKPDTIPGELRKSNSAETQFLETLFKILEKNLDNITMDVEFLAKELGISRTVLYEKLHILTGQPVADFIKTYRLNRAAQLIEARDSNVSEIVWKVGFKSHAHFTRAFKHRFNYTPRDYIKMIETNK
jgi:DNA-binding response OmpR family regulator